MQTKILKATLAAAYYLGLLLFISSCNGAGSSANTASASDGAAQSMAVNSTANQVLAAAESEHYIIFRTQNSYSGGFSADSSSALAKLDEACDTDTSFDHKNRKYKAIIGVDSNSGRYGCDKTGCGGEHSRNWVLQPNTAYYNTESQLIKTSNPNAVFDFDLESSIHAGEDTRVWTGLDSNWRVAGSTCKGWTTAGSSHTGRVGRADATNEHAISKEQIDCNKKRYLYCAMQPMEEESEPPKPSQIKYTEISEGYGSSCALDTDGGVWCWGDNSLGQVGVGSTAIQQYYHPEPVQTSTKFSSISLQGKTACALASSGDIWCWGDNSYGQVGSGSDAPQFDSPQLVHSEVKFTALARGVNSACALDQTGATWCWGHNGAGQIGNGSTDYSLAYNTPQRIARNISFGSLAVGLSTVCALDASGSPWCWGDNASGKIDATSNILYNEPTKLNLPAGVTAFTKIAVGDSMTCGIDQSGDIWCWGANNYGQLGNGTNINSPGIPRLVVAPGVAFKKLALGIRSSCAIDSNNNTWCWGANSYYQIGNGKTNYSFNTPQNVQAPAANFSSITVGLYTACALDANGAAWCWGSNSLGQIGNDSASIAKFATPQAVTTITIPAK